MCLLKTGQSVPEILYKGAARRTPLGSLSALEWYGMPSGPGPARLVGAGFDRTLYVWNQSGASQRHHDESASPSAAVESILNEAPLHHEYGLSSPCVDVRLTALKWCESVGVLITAGDRGMLHVWDVTNGECLHAWQAHFSEITSLQYLPAPANMLLSSSLDGSVRVWDVAALAVCSRF
jgi:WD40 repeat protein